MFLERRTVSRKTPGDGKLEISKEVAGRLSMLGPALMLELGVMRAPAALTTMTCNCRASDSPHEHQFVESELLKTLVSGAEVDLKLNTGEGVLSIAVVG